MDPQILVSLQQLMIDNEIVEALDGALSAETRLIDDLGLDSVAMLELLTVVEEEFDITIDLDEIEIDVLNRAGSFASLIAAKTAESG